MAYIYIILGLVLGSVGGFFYRKRQVETKNRDLVEKSEQVMRDAQAKSKEIVFEARNEALKMQDEFKKEERKTQEKFQEVEERLMKKESDLERKNEEAERLRDMLEKEAESARKLREEAEEVHRLKSQELEKVAAMSKDEARDLLLRKVEEEYSEDIVAQIKKTEKNLQKEADDRAKWIIAEAMARYAAEVTAESTVTIVNLPSDELKGRIIGREGRNINAFEQITGVDVIIDDTPGSIVISCFDLVRRYVAKVALEKLLEDGRIHPARIEEMVNKVKGEVNVLIKELGEKAVLEVGVTGLHPNLVKILGRLKFRVTNGQNALKKAMEVAFIAGGLAAELGADEGLCKRAGLLHNIGKAVDHEVPGHFARIGGDIARKFGLSKEVVAAIEAQAPDAEKDSLEAQILAAAISIVDSRPGANKDSLDAFIRRLGELENLCLSFDGVERAYALQTGTKVRIFVDPGKVDDLRAMKLTHEITRKIEYDLQHPGPVQIHLIREVRTEAVAK